MNGTGLCSGRVEVKSNQSWASVLEADFDQKDAAVVCRELGCGSPLALQGVLHEEGNDSVQDNQFDCHGNESHLVDCPTSESARNISAPAYLVGVTCSGTLCTINQFHTLNDLRQIGPLRIYLTIITKIKHYQAKVALNPTYHWSFSRAG